MAGYENVWCGTGDTTIVPPITLDFVDASGSGFISVSLSESELSFSSPLCTFQGLPAKTRFIDSDDIFLF